MVHEINFRLMQASETTKLQTLLRRCYDDSYYDALYYDSNALTAAIDNHDLYSMVAVNNNGNFAAHIALRNHRNSFTADTSMAIVDPDYRAHGLLVKVGAAMYELCLQLKLVGLYLQAVTVHPYTQQSSLKGGSTVTGIYLNYTPAFTRFLEIDAQLISKATPAVILIQPLGPFPSREIIWPARYQAQLQQVFNHAKMARQPGTAKPVTPHSVIRQVAKAQQKICYLWVDSVGCDLAAQLTLLLSELDADDFNVCYLQLPLDQCELDDSIMMARELGFFYAGTLPEYGQRDWLSLQRLDQSQLNIDDIHLANQHCQQLLQFILEDQP